MQDSDSISQAPGSGLIGSLKFVCMLAIAAIAVLAGLFVLELVSPEMFAEIAAKVGVLAAIVALALILIVALLRTGNRRRGSSV
jgi:uncharacterized membrane protein